MLVDGLLGLIYWDLWRGLEIWVMNDYGVEDSWTLRSRVLDTSLDVSLLMGCWTNGLMVIGGEETNCMTYPGG